MKSNPKACDHCGHVCDKNPLYTQNIVIRDLFAGAAMVCVYMRTIPHSHREPQPLAQRAYEIADAMLIAREK